LRPGVAVGGVVVEVGVGVILVLFEFVLEYAEMLSLKVGGALRKPLLVLLLVLVLILVFVSGDVLVGKHLVVRFPSPISRDSPCIDGESTGIVGELDRTCLGS
jgi:hypothetical protein